MGISSNAGKRDLAVSCSAGMCSHHLQACVGWVVGRHLGDEKVSQEAGLMARRLCSGVAVLKQSAWVFATSFHDDAERSVDVLVDRGPLCHCLLAAALFEIGKVV